VVGNYREISDRELARLMEILPQRPLLAGEEGVRLSLAGAQGKLAVTLRNGVMLLPQHGAPSTHILKPSSQIFSGLVENEHFCMTLAARLGLPVAPVAIGNAQGIRYLQVARYDRRIMPDGEVERLHQEDFCQAMGIAPELKYQQEGGPNLKKCFELIRGASSVPGPDVLRLFDAVVFNYLIGNNDAHGKNFSLLHDGMGTRLAPLYDLVCTQAWQNLSTTLAMKIGGERKPNRVFVENWRRFFKDAGVAEPQAVKRLLAMTRQTIETTRMVTPGYPVCESVLPPLLENCRRVLALEW
jgi:serine/threonine-protein kinase HipA